MRSSPRVGGRTTGDTFWWCRPRTTRISTTCLRRRPRRSRRRPGNRGRHSPHLRLRRRFHQAAQRAGRLPGCVALSRSRLSAVPGRQRLQHQPSPRSSERGRTPTLRTSSARVPHVSTPSAGAEAPVAGRAGETCADHSETIARAGPKVATGNESGIPPVAKRNSRLMVRTSGGACPATAGQRQRQGGYALLATPKL